MGVEGREEDKVGEKEEGRERGTGQREGKGATGDQGGPWRATREGQSSHASARCKVKICNALHNLHSLHEHLTRASSLLILATRLSTFSTSRLHQQLSLDYYYLYFKVNYCD